jgi:hypothetical protein
VVHRRARSGSVVRRAGKQHEGEGEASDDGSDVVAIGTAPAPLEGAA